MLGEVGKELMFLWGEVGEGFDAAGGACDGKGAKGGPCFVVHHEGDGVGEVASELGEDFKALRVQVTPVDEGALGKPCYIF